MYLKLHGSYNGIRKKQVSLQVKPTQEWNNLIKGSVIRNQTMDNVF